MLLFMATKYAIQLVENMKCQKLHLTQRQISREVLVYFILHLQRRSWYVCNIYSEDVMLKPPPRELNSDTTTSRFLVQTAKTLLMLSHSTVARLWLIIIT